MILDIDIKNILMLIKSHHYTLQNEITKEKIDRHLRDITDTISEEDIKNIGTNLLSSDLIAPGESISVDEFISKNESERVVPTKWNLIS